MDDIINKTVYFAHPISHYNTEFEWEAIEVIIHMLTPIGEDPTEGIIRVMNPNQKWLGGIYKARKEAGDVNPFEIFREIVKACDIVVGVTFFDGALGAGVAEECKIALESGKPVFLLYVHDGDWGEGQIKLFIPFTGLGNYRVLTREETRARIDNGEM